MRININSISNKKPFVARGEIAAQDLVEYFDDADECAVLSPIQYDAKLLAHAKFIELDADIRANLELTCHRCGKRFERELELHTVLKLIDAGSVGDADEIVLEEDDLDTVTYQDDTIDLDAILLETVYLEIDGECICSDDCKGICIACGKNLNHGPCGCNK